MWKKNKTFSPTIKGLFLSFDFFFKKPNIFIDSYRGSWALCLSLLCLMDMLALFFTIKALPRMKKLSTWYLLQCEAPVWCAVPILLVFHAGSNGNLTRSGLSLGSPSLTALLLFQSGPECAFWLWPIWSLSLSTLCYTLPNLYLTAFCCHWPLDPQPPVLQLDFSCPGWRNI